MRPNCAEKYPSTLDSAAGGEVERKNGASFFGVGDFAYAGPHTRLIPQVGDNFAPRKKPG
jgi:hypothetical protein